MSVATKSRLNGHVKGDEPRKEVVIPEINFQPVEFVLVGTAPYVQNRFSNEQMQIMRAKQEAGSTSQGKKARKPKDFKRAYEQSMYKAQGGWRGIPAGAFRDAMIEACTTVGFHMTKGRRAIFVIADGLDAESATPLVKISKGTPRQFEQPLPNSNGVPDIRVRGLWDAGWEVVLRVEFDADMFTVTDIANLLMRAGKQVGVGNGRPSSSSCSGCGWGTFVVKGK